MLNRNTEACMLILLWMDVGVAMVIMMMMLKSDNFSVLGVRGSTFRRLRWRHSDDTFHIRQQDFK